MESHEPDLLDEVHYHEIVQQIQEDYTQIDIDTATRKLLDFAVKLTLNVKHMDEEDIQSLRLEGFSDESILDAVHLISYFNFVNRVLDALGAKPETDMRFGKEEGIHQSSMEYLPQGDEDIFSQGI
ncbi:MAG: hypothetical protein JSW20_03500 [Nitrospiraceae bacterium]|nr:MAG: hypothetical protein JSW20_03500 [Nitrospiraceae bacterium]